MNITNQEIQNYCMSNSSLESDVLSEIKKYTQNIPGSKMLSDRLIGMQLQSYIRALQATCVVDIGTFTGYSTLSMAEALPENGVVISCEKNPNALKVARQFFQKSAHNHKIQIKLQTALQCLTELTDKKCDLIFIDADKLPIKSYYEIALRKIKTKGIIIVDDVLWYGKVLEESPEDKRAQAMKKFNSYVTQDSRVDNFILPIRHGLMIIHPKN